MAPFYTSGAMQCMLSYKVNSELNNSFPSHSFAVFEPLKVLSRFCPLLGRQNQRLKPSFNWFKPGGKNRGGLNRPALIAKYSSVPEHHQELSRRAPAFFTCILGTFLGTVDVKKRMVLGMSWRSPLNLLDTSWALKLQ